MSNNIRLSKKYGANPTIPICFFCGKEKNEVVLLGKIGKRNEDIEAPRSMLLDYEPCEDCKKMLSKGITVIRCSTTEKNFPPIQQSENGESIHPTGQFVLIKPEAAKDVFTNVFDEDVTENIMKKGMCLLEDNLYDNIIRTEE